MDNTAKDITRNGEVKRVSPKKIRTLGGSYECKWDDSTRITVNGHLAAFSQFLECGGLFDRLVSGCPLFYTSHNAPSRRAVLATVISGILEGACRYRHLDRLPRDSASPELFGVDKFMSCDSVRRALGNMETGAALEWLWDANISSCADLLSEDYILDLDPTVKPLYGHQEGAVPGYNPKKPGRPSHVHHTLCCAELRLVLGVALRPGNETAGSYSLGTLDDFLKRLPPHLRPRLIRGDVGFGNEAVIASCEAQGMHCLFKVRRSPGIRSVWTSCQRPDVRWADAGQGWEGTETRVMLKGWTRERRVLVLRRRRETGGDRQDAPADTHPSHRQPMLPGFEDEILPPDAKFMDRRYDWEVLVTDLGHEILSMAQLYRDRGDCENIFDEMKNQWGWGGFTSHDIGTSAVMASLVMLVANWWNVFTRLEEAGDGGHREAPGTRRSLQRTVCRIGAHAGRRTLELYTAGAEKCRCGISSIMFILNRIRTASQLAAEERWRLVLKYAFRKYGAVKAMFPAEISGQLTIAYVT
ncbi:MAG: transposase [Victivallales bacterium]|nr:transposase [Victivallales bacterium]